MPTRRQLASATALAFILLGLAHCSRPVSRRSKPTSKPALSGSTVSTSVAGSVPAPSSSPAINQTLQPPKTADPPHPPANTEGCPDGMVRATGEYCPAVVQTCNKFHQEYLDKKGNTTVSERCLQFIEPSRCVAEKKQHLDFCIDRYEYPNQVGEKPWVLTSWRQAEHLCREQGKRLCTEDEYNFACEGPAMLPYATGYTRDRERCNIDREYFRPDHSMHLLTYKNCLEDSKCSAELKRLDQRHTIGSKLTCVSWCGAVDLNGNVNEWVSRPGQEPPHRSSLKGGWWGPVRNRCRPAVRFHKEFDYGYEAGFRCCKGFGIETPDPRFELERHKVSPEQVEALKTSQPSPASAVPSTPSASTLARAEVAQSPKVAKQRAPAASAAPDSAAQTPAAGTASRAPAASTPDRVRAQASAAPAPSGAPSASAAPAGSAPAETRVNPKSSSGAVLPTPQASGERR